MITDPAVRQLGATIANQMPPPAHPALLGLVQTLRERYRDCAAAVLFYGSCLRSGDPYDGLVDLYLIVDDYRCANSGRLKAAWTNAIGDAAVIDSPTQGMGAEDFPYFTVDPEIPSVYWAIGGTPEADFERAAAGGPPVPSHHSPLFKISPEPSVTRGVESTVVALLEMMPKQ